MDILRRIKETKNNTKDPELRKNLSFWQGEIERSNSTNQVKILEGIKKTLEANLVYAKDDDSKNKVLNEIEVLSTFLPAFATEAQIREVASSFMEENKSKLVGLVIKHFKTLDIPVDGNLVQKIVKE